MRSLGLLTAAAITAALLMAVAANASTDREASAGTTLQSQIHGLRQGIAWHRSMTWHFEDRAGVPRTRSAYAERRTRSVPYLNWLDRLWSARQIRARHLAARTPQIAHLALWECIHSGEGAWNDDTGNGYYGGLQMTSGWGGVARPDLLSPTEQMALAERGYRASGYSHAWLAGQWPNTYPPCARFS